MNKRLSRKDAKFKRRNEQLDLVIVVDRLLTGFDAPCMSVIYIDRQPMGLHDLIQAFQEPIVFMIRIKHMVRLLHSRPHLFKECVDNAVKLYSAGGTKEALLGDWNEIEAAFKKALAALKNFSINSCRCSGIIKKKKNNLLGCFKISINYLQQLKSFTNYEEGMLENYGITEQEYEDYAGHYLNVKEEIKSDCGRDDEQRMNLR